MRSDDILRLIRRGEIKRPSKCERCMKDPGKCSPYKSVSSYRNLKGELVYSKKTVKKSKIHAHHCDYTARDMSGIMWLCNKCHAHWHTCFLAIGKNPKLLMRPIGKRRIWKNSYKKKWIGDYERIKV